MTPHPGRAIHSPSQEESDRLLYARRLANIGTSHIKALAPKVLPDPSSQLKSLGSLYVCDESGVQCLEEEFRLLHDLGCTNCEMWGRDRVEALHGAAAGFVRGIFFPDDAIIDSSAYAVGLIKHACATGAVILREKCPRVTSVGTEGSGEGARAAVRLADGTVLYGRHALVCTGRGSHGHAHRSTLASTRPVLRQQARTKSSLGHALLSRIQLGTCTRAQTPLSSPPAWLRGSAWLPSSDTPPCCRAA